MSAIRYTPLQLRQLSDDRLRSIITEEGWRLPIANDQLSTYILNMQDGKTKSLMLPNFSSGMVLGTVDATVGALQDYYLQKVNITSQLISLSDPALFAVVDRLGRDLILSPPYVRVDNRQLKDKTDLVWYLVGILSE